MKLLHISKKDLAGEYNAVQLDGKEDFAVAEINSQIKTVHTVEVLPPVITGAMPTYDMPAVGATLLAVEAEVLTGVSAADSNDLDITDNLFIIAGTELVPFVPETAGEYALEIVVRDQEADEATEEAILTLYNVFTVTYVLNGGNIEGSEADVVVTDVREGTLVGSAYTGAAPVFALNTWTTPYWVTTAVGSVDAAALPVTADVTVYAYWVLA